MESLRISGRRLSGVDWAAAATDLGMELRGRDDRLPDDGGVTLRLGAGDARVVAVVRVAVTSDAHDARRLLVRWLRTVQADVSRSDAPMPGADALVVAGSGSGLAGFVAENVVVLARALDPQAASALDVASAFASHLVSGRPAAAPAALRLVVPASRSGPAEVSVAAPQNASVSVRVDGGYAVPLGRGRYGVFVTRIGAAVVHATVVDPLLRVSALQRVVER